MRVLFDTNVLLDVLLDRDPFAEPAADLLSRAARREIQGFFCSTSVTTIFYLLQKNHRVSESISHVRSLLAILDVAPVHRGTLEAALDLELPDFEDAVIVAAAIEIQIDLIVTRDPRGFQGGAIPIQSPKGAVAFFQSLAGTR